MLFGIILIAALGVTSAEVLDDHVEVSADVAITAIKILYDDVIECMHNNTNVIELTNERLHKLEKALNVAIGNTNTTTNVQVFQPVYTGRVQCVNDNTFDMSENNIRLNNVNITFPAPYPGIPTVFTSISILHTSKEFDTRFEQYVPLESITESGFTLFCKTWNDTVVNSAAISYLAMYNH